MKKILLTLVLLIGIVVGLFAQKLTYQAVIRDNNQQLVVNTAVKATVTITFTTGVPYAEEVNGSTNIHGLLSFEFGDETLAGRDWTGATIAVKVVNAATPSTVYVNDDARPVSAVPYALNVNGQSIQNYLTEHNYVDETELDSRHYLTSDSTVITTMQGNIANLTQHTTKSAIRDSVAGQIHDSISNMANVSHIHTNKDLLDTYNQTNADLADAVAKKHVHDNASVLAATTAPYTDADSIKLKGIAEGAEVNVQADWNQSTTTADDYIKNKPTIPTVPTNVSAFSNDAGYITATDVPAQVNADWNATSGTAQILNKPELFSGNYNDLSNKPTIPAAANNATLTIQKNGTSVGTFTADASSDKSINITVPTTTSELTNNSGFITTANVPTNVSQLNNDAGYLTNADLTTLLSAINGKIDSLAHLVDSLSNLPHGNTPAATFTCGTDSIKDVDNNWYHTVKIGEQCWMKENLRTTTKRNNVGTIYTNNTAEGYNAETYGYYYDWAAVMQNESGDKVQGICPDGWHVPSDAEWTQLTTYVKSKSEYQCDGADNIANALSAAIGWSNTGSGCNAGNTGDKANATGFSAVPAGYCVYDNSIEFGDNAYFWSATLFEGHSAWYRSLRGYASFVDRDYGLKDVGFSVRCVRDAGVGGTPGSNETGGGTNPSTPGEVSCEQVMECMGDTLGKLNEKIEEQGTEIETLNGTVTSQGQTIETLNSTVESQGNTIDSLAHIVDSLSNLPHGGGDTPDTPDTPTVADGQPCPGTATVSDVDGNTYNTVKIGDQCWMKENLRTKTHQYGTVWTKTDADSAIYGRYYDWQAAMQIEQGNSTSYTAGDKHRGICPAGWHVPSDAEWTALTDYVNSVEDYKCEGGIAKALASKTGWEPEDSDCSVGNAPDNNDATGFSAVPAGYCFYGDFYDFGNYAYFWSATQSGDLGAWSRYLRGYASFVDRDLGLKDGGYSVRCLRDAGVGGGDEPSEPVNPVTPTDTFNCGTDKVSDVQNNEYNTVKIGNQCWTKENLRTNVGTGDYGYPTGVSGTADTVTYGRLYSWAAVMNGASASSDVPSGVRGICPEGWHVPSDAEWGNLINYVKSKPNEYKCGDDANNIANALSSETGWTNSSTSGCNAGDNNGKRNQTGFSAVPAGYFGTNSTNKGTHAYFWSTTDSGSAVYYRHLDNTSSSMNSGFEFSEDMGLSVRCLRN